MSLARLVYSLFRKVRSVLLLFITISLLFYYTFQNEIDILNSYALNDSLPSINNNEHDTETSTNLESATVHSSISDRISADKGNSNIILDLSDPATLREKNKYFPLLIRKSSNKIGSNSPISSLLTFKEKYAVLFEYSLPSQTSATQDEAHKVQHNMQLTPDFAMVQQVKEIFMKSWEQEQLLLKSKLKRESTWPIDLIDSLDTLYLCGETKLFQDSVNLIEDFDFRIPPLAVEVIDIPDVTNRVLEGLLSAYELSMDKRLLTKAKQVADFILRSFDTPNRVPILRFFWKSDLRNRFPDRETPSGQLTTMSLAFIRLSQLAHLNKYFDAVERVFTTIRQSYNEFDMDFMLPDVVDASGCQLLTSREIEKGVHIKGSGIMKSINEDFKFVHCQQLGIFLSSPSLDDSQEQPRYQSYGINEKTIPILENLLKIDDLFQSSYDILGGSSKNANPATEDANANDDIVEDGEYIEKRNLKSGQKKESAENALNGKSVIDSQMFLTYSISHIFKFMTFQPMFPKQKGNPTVKFLSSVLTKSQFTPATNELDVTVKRSYNVSLNSCRLGGILGLSSRISPQGGVNSKYILPSSLLEMSETITQSCFALMKEFDGLVPQKLQLDPCSDDKNEGCEFNSEVKSQMIIGGEYEILENDQDTGIKVWNHGTNGDNHRVKRNIIAGDELVENESIKYHTLGKTKSATAANDDEITQMRRVYTFGKDIKPHITKDDIVGYKWTNHPDWPLWVNKVESRRLLDSNIIESIFYMYRISGEEKWRSMGRQSFEILLRELMKLNSGAKGMWQVKEFYENGEKTNNDLPSYWFSRTLKYYLLLFSGGDTISLDEYILTQGGHIIKKK
ncbi:putative mannosidase MNL2 [Saccharomyces eubayanus]|uniref:putative mannosidase MNL2 n=1 Tax=Saccharomyces eubayanus TaxID=1080349 RepID=UPI0006BEDD65|nr:MNL2-like protein [Saccharomyces eubayanus]KOG97770.1 MNL2-like protein [Saccharomyces eubayanus]